MGKISPGTPIGVFFFKQFFRVRILYLINLIYTYFQRIDMKIIYATYVDHQREILYPVDFQVRENPDLIVFCSDEANRDFLASCGISAEPIGFGISHPVDIAIVQNMCVDRVFSKYGPDFLVWVQADIFITEFGHSLIKEFCVSENRTRAVALMIQHLRLMLVACQGVFGITVIGKDSGVRFMFDGAYVNSYKSLGGFDLGERNLIPAVDIGYLTVDQYKRHRRRHNVTWNECDNNFHVSDMDYAKFVLQRDHGLVGSNGVFERDTYLFSLISKMGLVDEYEKLRSIFGELGRLPS